MGLVQQVSWQWRVLTLHVLLTLHAVHLVIRRPLTAPSLCPRRNLLMNTAKPEASIVQNHSYLTAAALRALPNVTPEHADAQLMGLGMTRAYDVVLQPQRWTETFVSGTHLPRKWDVNPLGGKSRVVLPESDTLDHHLFWLSEGGEYAQLWGEFVARYVDAQVGTCPGPLRPTTNARGEQSWSKRAMEAAIHAFQCDRSGSQRAASLRRGASMEAWEYKGGICVGGVKLKPATPDSGIKDSCFVCVPEGGAPVTLWCGVIRRVLQLTGPATGFGLYGPTALVVAADWYPMSADLDHRIDVPKVPDLPVQVPNGSLWRAKSIVPTHLFLLPSPWDHRFKLVMHRDGTLQRTLG